MKGRNRAVRVVRVVRATITVFRRLFMGLKPNFVSIQPLEVSGYTSIPSVHGIVGCMLAARGEQQRDSNRGKYTCIL